MVMVMYQNSGQLFYTVQLWCSNLVSAVTAACESDSWDLEILWLRTLLRGGLAWTKTHTHNTQIFGILLCRKQTAVLLMKPFKEKVAHILWTVFNMTTERLQKAFSVCQTLNFSQPASRVICQSLMDCCGFECASHI